MTLKKLFVANSLVLSALMLFTLIFSQSASAVTSAPVYRFRNESLGGSAHFYTINEEQKKTVIENSKQGGIWEGTFVEEGKAFGAEKVKDGQCQVGEPVYRFRNEIFGSAHFYTISTEQYNEVKTKSQIGGDWEGIFVDEGIAFCAFSGQAIGTSPVYKFRNDSLGGSVHFYTINQAQYNTVLQNSKSGGIWDGIFVYEEIAFYAYPLENTKQTSYKTYEDNYELSLKYDSSKLTLNELETGATDDNCAIPGHTGNVIFQEGVYIGYSTCGIGFGSGPENLFEKVEEYTAYTKSGQELNFRTLKVENGQYTSSATWSQTKDNGYLDYIVISFTVDTADYTEIKGAVKEMVSYISWI